jgi:hypothetical protein
VTLTKLSLSDYNELLTGGNHLASALIGILGARHDEFPPYTATNEEAEAIIVDANHYDLWVAWKQLMIFRDKLRTAGIIE